MCNSITSVKKKSGEITGYVLDNGKEISKEKAVSMAKSGKLEGVGVATSREGTEYIRSVRDDDQKNNLESLPVVES